MFSVYTFHIVHHFRTMNIYGEDFSSNKQHLILKDVHGYSHASLCLYALYYRQYDDAIILCDNRTE